MSQLQVIGASGIFLVIFAAFFLVVEVIKGIKIIWDFVAPKYLGIKTNMARKKELEELTIKNSDAIKSMIESQKERDKQTFETMTNISNTFGDLKDDIDTRFSSIERNIGTLYDTVQDIQLESMRSTILNFGTAVGNNKIHSREQYNNIKKIYRIYHEIIKSSGKENDEIEINYNKIILPAYEKHIQNHDFLEYVLENSEVNEAIKEEINNSIEEPVPEKKPRRRRTTKKKAEESA